jgi:hypothetical protein
MGGNIKRAQKTHFLFSVAKSQEQKQENLANIQIIKSRMTKDGQVYENAIYNNDTLEIRCFDSIAPSTAKSNQQPKKKSKDQPLDTFGGGGFDFTSATSKYMEDHVDKKIRDKHKDEENKNTENGNESQNPENQGDDENTEKI